jgi:hypothetical protein
MKIKNQISNIKNTDKKLKIGGNGGNAGFRLSPEWFVLFITVIPAQARIQRGKSGGRQDCIPPAP